MILKQISLKFISKMIKINLIVNIFSFKKIFQSIVKSSNFYKYLFSKIQK